MFGSGEWYTQLSEQKLNSKVETKFWGGKSQIVVFSLYAGFGYDWLLF